MSVTLGYCTNVHAGGTLAETKASLERHACAVRAIVAPSRVLPIGLWLSARAAQELTEQPDGAVRLREWLYERGLVVFTMNGFPYGDFHAGLGKRRVYEPHWADVRRALYTMQLADILVQLLPDATMAPELSAEGSISTLPLGWRTTFTKEACGASIGLAAAQLTQVAKHLRAIEDRTGVCIHLDIEPEPGCMIDRAQQLVDFFEQCVRPDAGLPDPSRHLRVCHDICHSAVMFEPQSEALETYRKGGLRVGKVQVSSALECDGSDDAFRMLRNFDEPKFLHQTCVLDGKGEVNAFEDLGDAFDTAPDGAWRSHFHVPVDLEELGPLSTTQREILAFLDAMTPEDQIEHFEVETYAWGVLPLDFRRDSLARGIADELIWTREKLTRRGIPVTY
jgi:sugar phosphate isomerase/epimerase